MAYSALDIIGQVQSKIKDSSFSQSDLLVYINHVNRRIHNRYELRYMETSGDFTLVIGQASIGSLPTNLQTPINARLTSPVAYAGKLKFIEASVFDDMYGHINENASNNTPQLWYGYGGVINLYPKPDQAYTLKLRYRKTPTTLTVSTQPDVPEEFQELLTLGAYAMALEKRDYNDQAALMQAQYQDLMTDLLDRYGPQQSGEPHIMPTFLDARG